MEMPRSNTALTRRFLLFAGWTIFSLLLFLKPVASVVRLSFSQDDSSYLVPIPLICAVILYLERRKIFLQTSTDKIAGATFLLLSTLAALTSFQMGKSNSWLGWQNSGWILALLLLWAAGFALLFGEAALKAARFPFLFLLLMTPIPPSILDRIILLLQEGSAWITGQFFDLAGVPVLREGLVFHLARVNIEVARECSGIRSSMALLILSLLVAHFRLRNLRNKILLVTVGLFTMIVKNGIRIASLTLLAVYVDPAFLFGRLHRQGGVVFFLLALVLLLPVLLLLERTESKKRVSGKGSPGTGTESQTTVSEL